MCWVLQFPTTFRWSCSLSFTVCSHNGCLLGIQVGYRTLPLYLSRLFCYTWKSNRLVWNLMKDLRLGIEWSTHLWFKHFSYAFTHRSLTKWMPIINARINFSVAHLFHILVWAVKRTAYFCGINLMNNSWPSLYPFSQFEIYIDTFLNL